MAVDKHPSRHPSHPAKPHRTTTTSGTDNKVEHGSGQHGVPYGFKHELTVHDGESSRHHDFHHRKDGTKHMHHMAAEKLKERIAGHAGDEKRNDEPG